MEHELKHKDGIREKKRREMRRRITEVGLNLFAENGYDTTTLDAIAEASGIARRTFFHYFRSKEEIILAWQNALPDELHAEILKQDRAASPIAIVQAAMTTLAINMRPDVAVLIGKIVQKAEQLQLGNQAKFLRMEHAAYEALCELWSGDAGRFGLRLAAMVGVGTMRLSIDTWIAEGCLRPLGEHLEANFRCLKLELGAS